MTLSQRTILIIVSTFIALLFILAVTSDIILLKSYAALERVVVADNIQKVRNEIEESYDELHASSHEFGEITASRGYQSLSKLPVITLRNQIKHKLGQGGNSIDLVIIEFATDHKQKITVRKRAKNQLQGVAVQNNQPAQ